MGRKVTWIVGHRGQDGTFLRSRLGDSRTIVGIGRDVVDVWVRTEVRRFPFSFAELASLMDDFAPDEIYYFAAHHFSSEEAAKLASRKQEIRGYWHTNVWMYSIILRMLTQRGIRPRVVYASSSKIFEGSDADILNEDTAFAPRSPYAVSKAQATWLSEWYRNEFALPVFTAVLFNHESCLRPASFFSRKVSTGAVRIKHGLQSTVRLGSLETLVDWGYAGDYVNAMANLVSSADPGSYVIATGERHSAMEFVELAFEAVGLDWRKFVEVGESEVPTGFGDLGVADCSKIRIATGWHPRYDFGGLVSKLVIDELEEFRKRKRE